MSPVRNQPSSVKRSLRRGLVVAARPTGPHLELAHRLPIPREPRPSPRARSSMNGSGGPCFARASSCVSSSAGLELAGGRRRDRPDGAHLGHPPAVDDMEAVPIAGTPSIIARGGAEPPTSIVRSAERSQPPGLASSACEDPQPDRRDPGGERDPLATRTRRAGSPGRGAGPGRPARADEGAAEREAPGVRVEHRHDREDGVALVHRERARPTSARGSRSRGASRRRPSACPVVPLV